MPSSLLIKPNEVGNKLHCALNPVSVNNDNVDTFINVFNGTMQNSECNSADCNTTNPNIKVKLNPLAKKSVQNKSMDSRIPVNEIKPFSVSGISNENFLFDTTPEVQEVSTSASSNMVTEDNNTLNENSLLDTIPNVQEFANLCHQTW